MGSESKRNEKILKVLNSILDGSITAGKSIRLSAEERKHLKEFRDSLQDEKHHITDDNVIALSTGGVAYKDLCKSLREHNIPAAYSVKDDVSGIPCVAFSNSVDSEVVILVPKQYETEADKVLDMFREKARRVEIDSLSFSDKYFGSKNIFTASNLTAAQIELIRRGMRGRDIEYSIQEEADGTYRFRCDGEKASAAVPVVSSAIAQTKAFGKEMDARTAYCAELQEAVKTKYLPRPDQTIYMADVKLDTGAPIANLIYRVDSEGLHAMSADRELLIASRDSEDFDAQVMATMQRIDYPAVKAIPESEKQPAFGKIFARKELSVVSERFCNAENKLEELRNAERAVSRAMSRIIAKDDGTGLDVLDRITTKEGLWSALTKASSELKALSLPAKTEEIVKQYAYDCKTTICKNFNMHDTVTYDELSLKSVIEAVKDIAEEERTRKEEVRERRAAERAAREEDSGVAVTDALSRRGIADGKEQNHELPPDFFDAERSIEEPSDGLPGGEE